MNLKLLFIINDNEKKINSVINKFLLPFNYIMYGDGTASQGILDFLGLVKTKKNILLSIIADHQEEIIMKYLKEEIKINEIGNGIAFTVPLSSSSKYVRDAFKEIRGEKMNNTGKYHLIVTIANEGSSEKIMNIAKKNGANGGTLIKGRGLGGKNSFKLFNMTVEPEKDILLIICKEDEKNKIMNAILEKNGMNTDNRGVCFSLPINQAIGFDE